MNTSQVVDEIKWQARSRNALILSHYYQRTEIQDIADFIGDSLDLSRKAAESDEEVIVFAGVYFMAETAKILAPDKKVLIPNIDAGCSLADNCYPAEVASFKRNNPDHIIVTYVNSSAEIKAMSDYVCTSANAVQTIAGIPPNKPILFLPDKNLGSYLRRVTGRDIVLWHNSCVVHEAFSLQKIAALFTQYPKAKLVVHPECEDDLVSLAHFVGSTRQMIDFMKVDPAKTFIVGTEAGILHPLQKHLAHKQLIAAPVRSEVSCNCSECAFMKVNTLQAILHCLMEEGPEVTVKPEVADKARYVLQQMLLY